MQEQQQPAQPQDAPENEACRPAPQDIVDAVPPADEEADLEFRPVVKYTGIAVLLALLLGVEYATYRGGYSGGYADALVSGEVKESINKAAVDNLRHFMQAASADDDTLLSTIAASDRELAWIAEPSVRREAEWLLAQSALDRGRGEDATDLLAHLFADAPQTDVWARRALATARALGATAAPQVAAEYYHLALKRLEGQGNDDSRLVAMNELASLLAAEPGEGTLAELDALQKTAASLGEGGRLLRADILAYMGHLYRETGNEAEALRCFEEALAGVNADEVPALAGASVCFGLALLEKGDTERAEKLLREGVSRLGDTPVEATYLFTALRALARLELRRGATEAALAHLYRAEGAATGRLPENNAFWSCLYDQRGWVNVLKGAHESALADFRRVIDQPAAADEVKLQSFEGAGRCCIVLGDAENAALYLGSAAALREKLLAHDAAARGRVLLLLAQAQDMRGDATAAAEAYGRAAELLAGLEGEDNRENYLSALMGRAYALGQLGQWAEAATLWEGAQPLVAGDAAREAEVKHQLALCKRQGDANAEPEDTEADADDDAPAERPKPRNTRRNRRR